MEIPSAITVSSPSRLHLGLMPPSVKKNFGGAGVMLEQPRTIVHVHSSREFQASGPHSTRAEEYASLWWSQNRNSTSHVLSQSIPAVNISVLSAPDEHVGLGSGTQLALSIGRALNELHGLCGTPMAGGQDMLGRAVTSAMKFGRAARTGVGSVGFQLGGLVVDWENSPEATGITRIDFPRDWQILLVTVSNFVGMHGSVEKVALSDPPQEGLGIRKRMESILKNELLPSIQSQQFDSFCDAVYEFGCCSGRAFQSLQAGIFCTPLVAGIVEAFRAIGWRGVVQSSWGPTLGVFFAGDIDKKEIQRRLLNLTPPGTKSVWTRADNQGSIVSVD